MVFLEMVMYISKKNIVSRSSGAQKENRAARSGCCSSSSALRGGACLEVVEPIKEAAHLGVDAIVVIVEAVLETAAL